MGCVGSTPTEETEGGGRAESIPIAANSPSTSAKVSNYSKGSTASTPKTPKPSAHTPRSKTGRLPTLDGPEDEIQNFTLADIKAATANFSEEIGQGGFGKVYKGTVLDRTGQAVVPVAVKMLEEQSYQGPEEFMTEVRTMSSIRHPKILRLVGCSSDKCRALVYEYIDNGDVSTYLERASLGEVEFSFLDRVRVALGSAEALAIIHARGYIHRDFKASNVLLRDDLSPVLADFGLAHTIEAFQTHVTTRVLGSAEYVDPVYFEEGHLSSKCDVYSFGIFLIEVFSGISIADKGIAKIRDFLNDEGEDHEQMEEEEVIDEKLRPSLSENDVHELVALMRSALLNDWEKRPTMEDIVVKLAEFA